MTDSPWANVPENVPEQLSEENKSLTFAVSCSEDTERLLKISGQLRLLYVKEPTYYYSKFSKEEFILSTFNPIIDQIVVDNLIPKDYFRVLMLPSGKVPVGFMEFKFPENIVEKENPYNGKDDILSSLYSIFGPTK